MKNKTTVFLIAAVSAFPLVAASFAYYFWQPEKRMNYGELIAPTRLPSAALPALDGGSFDLASLKGQWILLQVDGGACDEGCRGRLYTMRQVRLAQGRDMSRLERVWLISDTERPAANLLADYAGTRVVLAAGSPLLSALPTSPPNVSPLAGPQAGHLYVIDPLGNLMMRYADNPDPSRIIKDLARLLRPARIGAG